MLSHWNSSKKKAFHSIGLQKYSFSWNTKTHPNSWFTRCWIGYVVTAPAKVQKFQQITTGSLISWTRAGCNCTSKGTKISANHNAVWANFRGSIVVTAPAKVQKFQQITTKKLWRLKKKCCNCTSKGTKISANHNYTDRHERLGNVVTAPAKVQKFQQITTAIDRYLLSRPL